MKDKNRFYDYSIIALIIIVPLVCVLLFLLPVEVQQSLMLQTSVLNPLTFFTSIFLHFSELHLLSNISVFLIITVLVYFINWVTNTQKKLLRLMLLTIFFVPFIYNILFYTVTRLLLSDSFISCGLSTAVAGLIGLTIPSLCLFLTVPVKNKSTSVYFAISLILITISVVVVSRIFEILFLTVFIVTLFFSIIILLKTCQPITSLIKKDVNLMWRFFFTGVVLAIYYVLVYLLFPASIITLDGSVVDVFAHLIGLFSGIIIASAYMLNLYSKRSSPSLVKNVDGE